MRMTVDRALAEYETARPRLPAAGAPGACRPAAHLGELAGDYDVFLLDAFGVLNIGEDAIPGVAARLAALRAQGKRLLVLTNAASVPVAALVTKYARLGFDFAPAEVISSRAVLLHHLRGQPPRRWGVMGAPSGDDLAGLDTVWLDDDPGPYDAAEGFLLLGSAPWSEARQTLLEAALRRRPRPVLVGNPDIVAPRADGFSIEPGHFAHRLADIGGVELRFFGKPFADIYDHAFGRLGPGTDRSRVLMVGDSLHTDILGAQAAGIGSALVAGYGFLAGRPAREAMDRTGIYPDWVLDRP